MMMMMTDYSYTTLSDNDEIIYSPVPFTVRPDPGQSAGSTWQLPLPPPACPRLKLKR
jgi:hypothetical protein